MPRVRSMSAGHAPQSAAAPLSPPWTAARAAAADRGARIVVVPQQYLHVAGVPLVLLGLCLSGFLLVYLKSVLLPFTVSVFIVYLLRPTVNLLTTPFSTACWCCVGARLSPGSGRGRQQLGRYSRLPPDAPGSDDAAAQPTQQQQQQAQTRLAPNHRMRPATPPKYPRTMRAYLSRALEAVSVAARGGGASQAAANAGGAAPAASSSGTGGRELVSASAGGTGPGSSGPPSPLHAPPPEDECGCCCGPCRFTRCPRWFGILVALGFSALIISGLVLLSEDG